MLRDESEILYSVVAGLCIVLLTCLYKSIMGAKSCQKGMPGPKNKGAYLNRAPRQVKEGYYISECHAPDFNLFQIVRAEGKLAQDAKGNMNEL